MEYDVISSKKINFPQSRERVFVIGYSKRFKKPKFILDNIKSVALTDNLENYLDDEIDDKYYITNHKWQDWICNQKYIDKKKMNINGKYIICQTARQYVSWFGNFILEFSKGAKFDFSDVAEDCINNNKIIPIGYDKKKFDHDYILKNSKLRRLTPNECLKLMGFSNFETICSDSQTYKQCGNSIIVNMFDEILKLLLVQN